MQMPMPLRSSFLLTLLLSIIVVAGCATLERKKEPYPAPDFSVVSTTGEEYTFSQLKGKPLVLALGATWCQHCMREAPIFKKVYDRYEGRVEMVGVLMKSPQKDAESLVKKNKLNFKIGLDPEGKVGKAYGVTGIPMIFFINRDGNIVDEHFGGLEEGDLVEKIETLLK
jgi:peroxiredoxin